MESDKSRKKVDPAIQAAGSYIWKFYEFVELLSHHVATYTNYLVELEAKYGKDFKKEKIIETEWETVIREVQALRYTAKRVYIVLESIKEKAKITVNTEFQEVYKHVLDNLVPERAKVEELAIELNKILINSSMPSLLENAQDIINQIYKDAG